jgi:5-methylcytosine-specific restriction endonuclease McrA
VFIELGGIDCKVTLAERINRLPLPVYRSAWQRVRLVVLERDGYECQIRGPKCLGRATEVDHVVPWREGGAWSDPTNLRASCRPCNAGRVSRPGGGFQASRRNTSRGVVTSGDVS